MRRFAWIGLIAALLVPATVVAATPAERPAASAVSFADAHGLRVLAVKRYDARDYNVRVLSKANIGRPLDVRILLPTHYAQHPRRHYPVLYLFHGTSGVASDWVRSGHAEQTTAPYPVITVMPECGFGGDGGFWFTNWVDRTTSHGPSQFESYLIDQLIPWVDANLRTIPARQGRAVAGLSQGGYGSAAMAARHPDLFAAMASFSGAPEIDRDPDVKVGATAVIEAIAVGDDRVPPGSMFGSRATDEINWLGHDPSTLMTNLRGMGIYLWTGKGAPGPYDRQPDPAASGIEFLVYESTEHFHQHLVDEDIPSYYDDYTFGTHSFPYWARDLRAFMKPMMATFAHPTTPKTVSYESIDRTWSQWGWAVRLKRSEQLSWSAIRSADARGFILYGNGTADVTTPASYDPGASVRVRVGPAAARTLTADPSGRLHIRVPLNTGPTDSFTNYTVKVTVAPAA